MQLKKGKFMKVRFERTIFPSSSRSCLRSRRWTSNIERSTTNGATTYHRSSSATGAERCRRRCAMRSMV